ncbi:hypothetical protein QTJ16_005493 [Diplocarpon rosae]|uniref:Uncharacterized protein n=1 Tax=Diplocarpon rosae TaxID=946125 RepID=A0AAD9SXV3_9HELO|nr:hypothetical protein QTJ16_005493 [Diplocarpon rosae]
MRFTSVSIAFVAALCQAVFAIPDGFVGLARLTPHNVSRNSTHEFQIGQTTPSAAPAGSGRAELRKRAVAIKGRSAEQIQHGSELAGKRVEWFGGAIWCTISMKQSCWAGYPSSPASEVPMRRVMESDSSVDSVRAVSPRAESHSPFAVDFACSLLSGFQVSNNCWEDDVKTKPKGKVSTTSASTLPTPTSAADATATHSS